MTRRSRPGVRVFTAVITLGVFASAQVSSDLLTVAEASGWRATARHADVIDFCEKLSGMSELVHREEMGRTREGRSLPILVIADPPVRTPDQVGDRLVAFAWAGIHSGEVCGKPASLMLAREMASRPGHPLLENLVIVFLPLLNADGNDRMNPDNRRGQVGPVEGMGTRANAQGLNINRDFTKLDTQEGRTIARILNVWDPAIVMDLHTTNGSRHRYVLTYDGQRHPACDDELRKLTRYDLLPAVSRAMERDTGYRTFFYGNFRGDDQWIIDDALPRYSTHYVGMRHHISLLSEAYSYASYQDRVMGTLAFVRQSFQWVADNMATVRRTIEAAKARTIELGNNPAPDNLVPLRRTPKLTDEPVAILGYAGGRGRGRRGGEPGEPREFQLYYNDLSVATLTVRRPYAYLLSADLGRVLANLDHHGIQVETLQEDTEVLVEVYRLDSIERAEREYEGHRLVTVEVTPRRETRSFEAGTRVVVNTTEVAYVERAKD